MATVVNVENYPSIEDPIAHVHGGDDLKHVIIPLIIHEKESADSLSLPNKPQIKDRKNSTDSGNESDDQNVLCVSSGENSEQKTANKFPPCVIESWNINNLQQKCHSDQFCSKFSIWWTIAATSFCVCLLYINFTSSKGGATNQNSIAPFIVKYNDDESRHGNFLPLINPDNDVWKKFESLAREKTGVHFHVGSSDGITQYQPIIDVKDATVQMSGRPSFCNLKTNGVQQVLNFDRVTHLHISETKDCDNYIHLILNHWQFPQVKSLRFHKVIIRENEFESLVKFIDKHAQTLYLVEIDECYLCGSSSCDAGKINFPEHDFQLAITRRKVSTALL